MSKEISAAVFDYSLVEKDTKQKLIYFAGQVRKHGDEFKNSGMEIGKAVFGAHELLSGERANLFEKWVETETEIGIRTAYDCLNVFKRSKDFAIIAKLPTTVAYLLAAPSTPDAAIREVERAVSKGQKPTVQFTKATLDRFREVSDKPKAKARTSVAKPPAKPPYVDPIEAACEHDYDDEACRKCHAPRPTDGKKISGGVTFDPAELSSESTDAFGSETPDDLKRVFELREGFKEQRSKLTSIKTWITQNEGHPGAAILVGAKQRLVTDIDQADAELKFCIPHCVCVYCHNKPPKVANCTACKGLGWITEQIYKAAPKGMQRVKATA